MKTRPSSAISLLFSLWLLLFACRGDVMDREYPPASILESAKIWFQRHSGRPAKESGSVPIPDWDHSWLLNTATDSRVLLVPTSEWQIAGRRFSIRRFFVFDLSGDQISDARIIEILGENYHIEDNLNSLPAAVNQERIPGFNGAIYSYGIDYKFLTAAVYKAGIRTNIRSRILTSTAHSSGTAGFFPERTECKKIIPVKTGYPGSFCTDALVTERIDYIYDDNGCLHFASYVYLSHVCPDQGRLKDIAPYGGLSGKLFQATDCMGVSEGTAYMSSCGCIGGTSGISDCSKDPCKEQKNVSFTAARSDISTGHTTALSQAITSAVPKEYGFDIRLSTPGSNTYKAFTVRTGDTTSFEPRFTWNERDGFSVGAAYTRPRGSAPAPADLMWPAENLTDPDLAAGGASEMEQYQARVSITLLTATSTYIITVRDWTALQTLYNSYRSDPSLADRNYINVHNTYLASHPHVSAEDAGVYAALSIYGKAVNLYKAPAGSAAFIPLELDESNRVRAISCPSD